MNSFSRGNILSAIPPVTRFILIANVAVFILDFITGGVIVKAYLSLYSLHFHANPVQTFKAYQLISHMFLHQNLGHIFFNMFGLFIFGRILETTLGSKKFFLLYFISGLGAAGLQLLVYYIQMQPAAMLGASGAIMGVTAAFAVMFPNVELMLIFLPIPIKAKYLIPFFLLLELFFGVANFKIDNIAHFAHLGGAIAGFIMIKIWKKKQFNIY
jgi:membrane associated rhomboid family serine protease